MIPYKVMDEYKILSLSIIRDMDGDDVGEQGETITYILVALHYHVYHNHHLYIYKKIIYKHKIK